MTGKEVFKKAVKLERPERVPAIILSGGVWAFKQAEKSLQDSFEMTPEENADYWIGINEKINSDLIWCAAGCNNLGLRGLGAKADFSKVGYAATVEPMITKPSDVDKLDISKIKEDPGLICMLESTKLLKKKMGDKTMLGVSQWGPLTLGNLMMGASGFMKLLRKDPEGVQHILDFTTQLVVEYWKLFIEAGVEHVSQAEPVASGDMISRKMFEQYAFPALKKTNDMIGNKVFSKMIHICGNTTRILDLLPETGADMFSMDFKVPIATAREVLDGKMCFAGQLDPTNVMFMSTQEEVTEAAQNCIKDSQWEKGGYMIMPGCDLATQTPLENIQAMVGCAHSYTQIHI